MIYWGVEEYIFLFGLAFVWTIFAVAQDLKTREILNWLNFSLIAFALAYRAFYAYFAKDMGFFIYGFFGVLFFVVLAYVFYYGRVFAGGDAKLLMGFGAILPYEEISDYFYIGLGFIFLLFLIGALYSLTYSIFLIRRNKSKFSREFKKEIVKKQGWMYFAIISAAVLELIVFFNDLGLQFSLYGLVIVLLPFLYYYVRTVEKSCMIVLKWPKELQEGDWLLNDVRIGRKTIKKSVHGLSEEEIKLLRKAKKKVLIKDGIPFTPSFLIALLVGIWIWSRYFPL